MTPVCVGMSDGDHRLVLCPAHADPLSHMSVRHAVVVAQACPWCKVQNRPVLSATDKAPDPIVFGPRP